MALLNIHKQDGDTFTAAEVNQIGKAIDDNTRRMDTVIPAVSTKTTQTGLIVTLKPNTYNQWKEPLTGKLKVTLAQPDSVGEVTLEFVAGNGLVLELLPAGIKWVNDEAPYFEAGKTYVINISNKLAVGGAF